MKIVKSNRSFCIFSNFAQNFLYARNDKQTSRQFKYEMNISSTKNRMSRMKALRVKDKYNIMKKAVTKIIIYGPTPPTLKF